MRPEPASTLAPTAASWPVPVLLFLVVLLVAGPGLAQPTADRLMTDFEPSGDYALDVAGIEAEDAEIYFSRRAGAFLVLSEALPAPVLLRPRTSEVQTVRSDALARRSDGTVDLRPDPVAASHGSFRLVDGGEVRFSVGAQTATLRSKPYLLGSQSADDLTGYNPAYAHGARTYEPSAAMIEQLEQLAGTVKVEVYFGSWCPACSQMVPRIISVAEELEGSDIEFEFYGLPKPFSGEPRAEARGITAVPSGVIFRDGREVGRLSGGDWKVPELALLNMLQG